ncbi:MAG: recombination-associated protein RdgC [Bradymonadaceae bacterium]|nr:recombination-associated protein RdgC [Lujinxingiaceae bacterium]
MGALFGTLSYKIFYVQGEIEPGWQERYLEKVKKHAFEALTPEGEEEAADGWVPIDRPLNVHFDLHTFLFDRFINLGFRQDKYAIPTGILKAHIEEREREYLVQNNKERLGKFEREDIKLMVKRRLKEKQLPRMKLTDMSWDMQAKRVRFWSQSNTVCELFQSFFEETFELKLVQANPYVDALQLNISEELIEQLKLVEPCVFVDGIEQ